MASSCYTFCICLGFAQRFCVICADTLTRDCGLSRRDVLPDIFWVPVFHEVCLHVNMHSFPLQQLTGEDPSLSVKSPSWGDSGFNMAYNIVLSVMLIGLTVNITI